jgi:thiamine biosynthesis lipoprotein
VNVEQHRVRSDTMSEMSSPTAEIAGAEFAAWGGRAVVAVTDRSTLARAVAVVHETISAFDRACSSFRGDSEIAAINAGAPDAVQVGAICLEAIEAALRAARLTGGAVDPTVGRSLVALGFTPRSAWDRPASCGGRAPAPLSVRVESVPGYSTVVVDHDRRTVRVPAGVQLDLGATAKALAADHAARAAHEQTGGAVLVGLLGDIAVAGDPPPGGWRIRVTDDHRGGAQAPGQWIAVRGGGLATSSTTVRRREGSESVHHLIDPASGFSAASRFRTVTVAAASCLDANIAATGSIIRGERAIAWLTERGLPARLVQADGTVHHISGWPREGEELPVSLPGP